MISYRANLFESLQKHINLYTPGDLFESIVEYKEFPHQGDIAGNIRKEKGYAYLFSHMSVGKMILVQRNHGANIIDLDPKDVKKYLKIISHIDFLGFKVGDEIVQTNYELTGRHYKITCLGLRSDNTPKAYCHDARDNVLYRWDPTRSCTEIDLSLYKKV
jgi:hypothetical protein